MAEGNSAVKKGYARNNPKPLNKLSYFEKGELFL